MRYVVRRGICCPNAVHKLQNNEVTDLAASESGLTTDEQQAWPTNLQTVVWEMSQSVRW